ncbi:hypothetical protein F4808DRAFT_441721 [Astrocystis sublimbata]|nr:hypothetical protein F4808DRAFT_441721 [Astrocystis sublimbata]
MMDTVHENLQSTGSPSHDSLFAGAFYQDTDASAGAALSSPQVSSDQSLNLITMDASPEDDQQPAAIPATLPQETSHENNVTWTKRGAKHYPSWTVEPTIESVIATLKAALDTDASHEYSVRVLHEGKSSRLYDVSYDDQAFVMRVCMPLPDQSHSQSQPQSGANTRTEAEAATLRWVQANTHLPAPRLIAHDASRDNALGCEWLLMTKVLGEPLLTCWEALAMGSKERIVKQIAAFCAAAFERPFYDTSPMNAADWMQGLLASTAEDLAVRYSDSTEKDKEMLRRKLDIVKRLERLMPQYLAPETMIDSSQNDITTTNTNDNDNDNEPLNSKTTPKSKTMMQITNLSLPNILVNSDGILSGVLDWQPSTTTTTTTINPNPTTTTTSSTMTPIRRHIPHTGRIWRSMK